MKFIVEKLSSNFAVAILGARAWEPLENGSWPCDQPVAGKWRSRTKKHACKSLRTLFHLSVWRFYKSIKRRSDTAFFSCTCNAYAWKKIRDIILNLRFFKFHCEVDIRMSGVEIMQKPSSSDFTVEKWKFVIYISESNGGTKIEISHPQPIPLQSYTRSRKC